mgnify:CR=1 FL=1
MQKIIIIGVGAQGSTIAKTMNDDPNVSEIICADYDEKAANDLGAKLDKATALKLDASDIKNGMKQCQSHRAVNGDINKHFYDHHHYRQCGKSNDTGHKIESQVAAGHSFFRRGSADGAQKNCGGCTNIGTDNHGRCHFKCHQLAV